MMTLANTLKVSDIRLDLEAQELNAATAELANLLRHDRRILDWSQFANELAAQAPCMAGEGERRFCIPHARTESVQTLVISAGRSRAGLSLAGEEGRCHYVFVMGIPSALAAEYLRIIGALARIFREPAAEKRLRKAETPEEFHEILSEFEMKL